MLCRRCVDWFARVKRSDPRERRASAPSRWSVCLCAAVQGLMSLLLPINVAAVLVRCRAPHLSGCPLFSPPSRLSYPLTLFSLSFSPSSSSSSPLSLFTSLTFLPSPFLPRSSNKTHSFASSPPSPGSLISSPASPSIPPLPPLPLPLVTPPSSPPALPLPPLLLVPPGPPRQPSPPFPSPLLPSSSHLLPPAASSPHTLHKKELCHWVTTPFTRDGRERRKIT